MNDEELVRAAMTGHRAAQCELARRSHRRVFALCCSRVAHWHDAEELTQEVLVRAMVHVATLDAPERYLSWLRGIAGHVCTDWHRRHGRESRVKETVSDDVAATGFLRPDQEAARHEEQSRLMQEVERLPAELKEVLLLHYFDDLTYDQLAEWLGVARATVSERLSRARMRLRSRLIDAERYVP